jgi:imidazolonepropionase-like amidohydrolase
MTSLLIDKAVLIDGTGSTPSKKVRILIESERIAAVGRDLDIPDDAKIIDVAGRTVMPGIMDLHIHLGSDSLDRKVRRLTWGVTTPPALKILHAAHNAKKCLEAGVTTLRSVALEQDFCWDPSLREAINLGVVQGPRILASAGCVRRSGNYPYGGYVGMPDPFQPVWRPADGPYQCRRAVREAVALGADFIKFFSTGSVGGAGERHTWVTHTLEEIEAICDEAHRHERKAAVHAHGTQGIKDALLGGVDTVEHGTYMDEECIELMLERKAFHVPTLTIVYNLIKRSEERDVPEHMLRKAEETWEHHVPSVKMSHKAGVRIACGTDFKAGVNAQELELLVKEAGLTPMEAIVAATKTSAEAIGRENELGTLEPGKYADLLIVDGDPLKEIGLLQNKSRILKVIKGGKIEVDREKS